VGGGGVVIKIIKIFSFTREFFFTEVSSHVRSSCNLHKKRDSLYFYYSTLILTKQVIVGDIKRGGETCRIVQLKVMPMATAASSGPLVQRGFVYRP